MKVLIREKLSTHKQKTPEGYLICMDAVLARTGEQEYRRNELWPETKDDTVIKVARKAEQVFAPETLASFENKPLTCEHPDEDVNPENYKTYSVGFVRDVRQSKVDGQDVIIGNLVVTDPDCINDIENGVRTDLSCGYNCDITDGEAPEQINIRGNHVALCQEGRAGIARIIDSKIKDEAKYVVYADTTWRDYKALFARHDGAPRYTTEANADKFNEADAKKKTQSHGNYKWIMRKVSDSKIKDSRFFDISALKPISNFDKQFVNSGYKYSIVIKNEDAEEIYTIAANTLPEAVKNANEYLTNYFEDYAQDIPYKKLHYYLYENIRPIDKWVIALTASPDTWLGYDGPTKNFDKARVFTDYDDAKAKALSYGGGSVTKIHDAQSTKVIYERLEAIPESARREMTASKNKAATLLGIISNIEDIVEASDPKIKAETKEAGDKIIEDLKKQFNIKLNDSAKAPEDLFNTYGKIWWKYKHAEAGLNSEEYNKAEKLRRKAVENDELTIDENRDLARWGAQILLKILDASEESHVKDAVMNKSELINRLDKMKVSDFELDSNFMFQIRLIAKEFGLEFEFLQKGYDRNDDCNFYEYFVSDFKDKIEYIVKLIVCENKIHSTIQPITDNKKVDYKNYLYVDSVDHCDFEYEGKIYRFADSVEVEDFIDSEVIEKSKKLLHDRAIRDLDPFAQKIINKKLISTLKERAEDIEDQPLEVADPLFKKPAKKVKNKLLKQIREKIDKLDES